MIIFVFTPGHISKLSFTSHVASLPSGSCQVRTVPSVMYWRTILLRQADRVARFNPREGQTVSAAFSLRSERLMPTTDPNSAWVRTRNSGRHTVYITSPPVKYLHLLLP